MSAHDHPSSSVRLVSVCASCHEPFTADEWEQRHSDPEGEDVHERCCAACADAMRLTDRQVALDDAVREL